MEQVRASFDLAHEYTACTDQLMLLVTMGMPASGEATLRHALASRLALMQPSCDVVRKRLIGMRPLAHRTEGH